jgi:hypothetical protein
MADLTQTISNSIGVYGASPTNLWNSMVWGTDNWGTNNDLVKTIGKVYTSNVGISSVIMKSPIKYIFESVNIQSQRTDIIRGHGIWDYVWPSDVSDHADRIFTTYSQTAGTSSIYSSTAGTSTSWSAI